MQLVNIKSERKRLLETSRSIFYKSNFQFLSSHNGFRPGKMHLFLGVASGGKSTLVRALMIDIVEKSLNGQTTLLWLSEESTEDFCMEFAKTGFDSKKLKYVKIFSELDMKANSAKAMLNLFESACDEVRPNTILLDNITTSGMYSRENPRNQGGVAKYLKKICKKYDAPLIVFAHTGGEITDSFKGLIESNHIRGSKDIVNLSEFLYIMQRIIKGSIIVPTLRITKHRGQNIDDRLFSLHYHKETMIYIGDTKLSFEEFKKKFQDRNVL